ncbi:MAG TPA: VRR-NUC domain-containing protein [Chitinophagaceae bacterium]|nr:VRR-NUC domain-containing protein [Chitinophagaceae bacterium]
MNEKLIEKKLREGVKKLGGIAVKFFVLAFTGFPDRIVLMPGGRIWFVETKTTGKTLSPRQKIVLPYLEKLGFKVRVIDRQELLDQFFKEIAI